ncbi:sialic acid-binding Ig-like lectin 15 [Erinaceus europaeus]|uniref:Sialic acid-binding Ig-like lectin 15 n=1 Tax=Erinaceus europaeus TaxID=9365 RepID=A0ABM3VVF4_ERIEU|nr:sialic acid-binding Ig-like lectin 15 [Erinaceus europaeus]
MTALWVVLEESPSLEIVHRWADSLEDGSSVRTERDTVGDVLHTEANSAQRWSMHLPAEVSAAAGGEVELPCTFSHPHGRYDGPLTATWRSGRAFAGPQVFRCVVARGSELCRRELSLQGRFHLRGDPRRNDLSLRIERLSLADQGRYFCRVDLAGATDAYESPRGVWLRVTAAPHIVGVWVLPGPAGTFRALCTAEGEPPPVLTWSGPGFDNSSDSAPASSAMQRGSRVTAELPALPRDGRYTCSASSPGGHAEASVYLLHLRGGAAPGLLLGALGLKALLLLLLLGVRAARGAGRRAGLAAAHPPIFI